MLPLFLNGHSSLGDASSISAGGQPVRQSSNMPSWVVPSTAAANTVVPCLFCDGASRGNPGVGGAGAIIFSPGGLSVLAFQHQRLGDSVTNNAAEYEVSSSPDLQLADTTEFLLQAVRMGLELAQNAGIQNVHLFLDSQLIVKQREFCPFVLLATFLSRCCLLSAWPICGQSSTVETLEQSCQTAIM